MALTQNEHDHVTEKVYDGLEAAAGVPTALETRFAFASDHIHIDRRISFFFESVCDFVSSMTLK